MPVVDVVSAQVLGVLVLRHRHRPGSQGESMAEESTQGPGVDALHQRVGGIVGTEATVVEVDRATGVDWCVPIGYPTPVQSEGRAKLVKVEAHDDAACVGVVSQHVTHPHGITIRAVGEGDDDVVRRQLR